MTSKTTIAEFCKKHQVERYLLNYQFKLNKIKKDEDKKFNEQHMLELLNIKEDNVEIQHLQNQLEKQKSHIEYLTNCNIENRTKIVELKSRILEAAVFTGLHLFPQTQALASPVSGAIRSIYVMREQNKNIQTTDTPLEIK
ncbi:hypothetical protein [Acinetobacter radioresistens]|uniref:hypothetical protein n=2 Tax=Acinetobacter radioresistens TaxID=40216 RepID=UPI0021CDC58D|nr:hypothetical protein [Acinetobacter radioresistens]